MCGRRLAFDLCGEQLTRYFTVRDEIMCCPEMLLPLRKTSNVFGIDGYQVGRINACLLYTSDAADE